MSDLQIYEPSKNKQLSTYLLSLEQKLEDLALENLKPVLASGAYTGGEVLAMKEFEKLQLMNDYDLGGILIRAKIIDTIEQHKLYNTHPMGFKNLKEAAAYYKISYSRLSNIQDWCRIVFPYYRDVIGKQPHELLDEIGESNLRELTPILKAIVTGEEPQGRSAQESLKRILDDIDLTIEMSGEESEPEKRQKDAFEWALMAGLESNRTLRKTLRPEPPLNATLLRRNGTSFLLVEMDERQTEKLVKSMGEKFDFVYVDLEKEDINRIPAVKQLMGAKNGQS
jgi:hypothetical protein